MSWFAVSQIDFLCLILIGYMCAKEAKSKNRSAKERSFLQVSSFITLFITFDIIYMLQHFGCIQSNRASLYFSNIGYYISVSFICAYWLYMVKTFLMKKSSRGMTVLQYLPIAVLDILILLSPAYGFIFTIDSNLNFRRGYLNFLFFVVEYGYMLVTIFMLLRTKISKKEIAGAARQMSMAYFPIPMFIASIVQIPFPQLSIAPIGCTFSLLLCYSEYRTNIASIDQLTKLYSRNIILSHLEDFIQRGKRYYLVMLDIDSFKKVNDVYGHVVGDILLIDFANELRKVAATYGYIPARYAGDEFLVACKTEDDSEIQKFCKDLDEAISTIHIHGTNKNITVSHGYAYVVNGMAGVDELIASADRSMYLNKRMKKEVHMI